MVWPLLSFLALIGLVFWQVDVLKQSEQLRSERFEAEAEKKLQEIAGEIALEGIYFSDSTLAYYEQHPQAAEKVKFLIDSLMTASFTQEGLYWAIAQPEKQELLFSNAPDRKREILLSSALKACISCMLITSFKDYDGKMIIHHSVASISGIRGDTPKDLSEYKYLTVLNEPPAYFQWKDYLAFLLIGIVSLVFGRTLYLNTRQQQLIEQKDEFVNHLSHQFKTPLSSIRLGTNILLTEAGKPKQQEMLQRIQLEGNRLDRHIQTVLQWVKSGTRSFQPSPRQIEVNAFSQQMIKQFEAVFANAEAQITFCPSDEEVQVLADPDHLALVYYNIWENAIRHNPAPLHLTLRLKRENGKLTIAHADNGKGFIPKKEKHVGLGLAYIKRIMKAMNGRLQIQSEVGKGSCITLIFPEV